MAIIMANTTINWIHAGDEVLNMNTESQYDVRSDDSNLHPDERQIAIPAGTQPAVLVVFKVQGS